MANDTDGQFETIFNSISDGVFAVDAEWRITCFNSAAERTLKMGRDDAVGQRCHEVFRSNICEEACALRYTMETGKPIVNLLIHIRDAHGNRVPVQTVFEPDAKVGDWVLIHAGFVIKRLEADEAEATWAVIATST